MKSINKKFMIMAVLFAVCVLIVTGCSFSPTYYSEREIKNYVKNVFGKEYKLTKVDAENHDYMFSNREGFTFTVSAYTYNAHFDASETMFYQKGLRIDYTERVLEYHADEIKELLNKYDLDVDTSDVYYKIYVNDANEFEPLSEFISELDHILAYNFNNDKIPRNMSEYRAGSLLIVIYFEDTVMSRITLSSSDDERLETSQVYTYIEEDYVNCIKAGELNIDIDKELWDKYPAGEINTVYINGEPLNTDEYDLFTFYYSRDAGIYVMFDLDPFEEFEHTPYSYKDGALAYLVNRLGGTYTSIDWNEATWTVDGVTWIATIHTRKDDTTYLEVRRNGVKLELTDIAIHGSNEDSTGRYYTIEDLELMLDLEIEIDQTKLSANMTKK